MKTLRTGPIGFLLPSVQGGGLDRSVFAIARGLRDRGHDVRLVLATETGRTGGSLPAGVQVDVLGARRVRHMVPALRSWLVETGVRRIHAVAPSAVLAATIAARTVRSGVVVSGGVHNLLERELEVRTHWLHRSITRAALIRAYRDLDGIVALNAPLAAHVTALLGSGSPPVAVIPSPVMDRIVVDPSSACPHPWLEDPDRPVIVTTGRLHRQKDHPTLLHALALARERMPGLRAIVLGDGPDRAAIDDLRRVLDLADAVLLAGHREDRLEWVRRADLYVQSSAYEGLGGALIEALALGVPVVSTDAPHGPSTVLADGQLGDLVAVGDAPALADRIVERLTVPRQVELGSHLDQFRLAPVLDGYERLFALSPEVVT